MDRSLEIRLVERAARGDGEALDRLWDHHRRWVAAIVLAHKPAEADLDDLLQDVAAALVVHVRDLRDPSRLRPWLRALARNTSVSRGRRTTLERRHMRPLADGALQVPDDASRVEERVGARIATSRTLAAMADLTADQRECLLLRAVQGMTQRAIAERLEVPVTTVETRLAKARRGLRAALRDPVVPERHRRSG